MESLIFLVQERSGNIKSKTVGNGSTQRAYIDREDTSSPIVDSLPTVGTARQVPLVNNTYEGQTAASGQHWTVAIKHRFSAHY